MGPAAEETHETSEHSGVPPGRFTL